MNQIDYRKKDAEFSTEEYHALAPQELLGMAKQEKEKAQFMLAKDYAEVIKELRERNFTWMEISAWFTLFQVPFSLSSIRRAYREIYEKGKLDADNSLQE